MNETGNAMGIRAALIIPALNEEEVIATTLRRVPRSLFRMIVVADNGSRDRTAEIARTCGAEVVREPERGYGAACLGGIAALPGEIEAVVFMQADSSEDPEEARLLLAPIEEGRADLVIGSRTLGKAEPGALLPHQVFGNRLATFLMHCLHGFRYTDLGPFRAIRRDALARLNMRDRGYGWTVEMQVRALQHGLRVLEVPVSYARRAAGENKVSGNIRASILAGAKILWTILRLSIARPKAAR
jgi:glycosyltransferase involved in cell wall biosynthesis